MFSNSGIWFSASTEFLIQVFEIFCFIFNLFNKFLAILPSVILLIYVLLLYKKINARFALTAVLLLLAYPVLSGAINLIINPFYNYLIYSNLIFGNGILWSNVDFEFVLNIFLTNLIQYVFINLLPRLPLLLCVVFVLIGLKKKFAYIVALILSLLAPLLMFFSKLISIILNDFGDFEDMFEAVVDNLSGLFESSLQMLSIMAIIVAVMIFIIANMNLITKTKSKKEIINTAEMNNLSTEELLRFLQEKLDNGDITKEEYQAQREIVINKL